MGLISIDMNGALNACGHCGHEFFVKFQDMLIDPSWVTFPTCPGCNVASDSYLAISSSEMSDDTSESNIKRHMACQTLYKRAFGKAKKPIDLDFSIDPNQVDLAEDDDVVVEPPLHSAIKGLRDKKRAKDGK